MLKILFLLVMVLSFSSSVISEESLTKKDLQEALKLLRQTGKLPKSELDKVEKQINSMNDSQVKELQDKALNEIKNNPDILKNYSEGMEKGLEQQQSK